jgi:hypothetical protein
MEWRTSQDLNENCILFCPLPVDFLSRRNYQPNLEFCT